MTFHSGKNRTEIDCNPATRLHATDKHRSSSGIQSATEYHSPKKSASNELQKPESNQLPAVVRVPQTWDNMTASSHRAGVPKKEELSSDTEHCQVKSPDEYDLFDDKDNSQLCQSSFADPITPTPARKRFCERAETQPYNKRSCRSLPCSEFGSGSQAGTSRSPNTSRPTSSQPQSQSPGPRFSGVLRSSSASAGFAEKTKNLLRMKDKLPLGKLGLAISQNDILADYHAFVSYKMGDVRPDVEEGKSIAQRLSHVRQPSDLIVRQLMDVIEDQSNMIIGLTAAVDSCMLRLTRLERELDEERRAASAGKKCQEAKLPEETCLAFENLTQMWHIPQLPVQEWPDLSNARFKSVDLNEKMASWIRTNRGRPNDHVTACTDFFRAYLKEACEPPVLVKRYAVRISRSCAKRADLHDLPEQVAEQLIGVCLDGLRLGMWELSLSAAALKRNPTPYWVALGETDEEREAELDQRKKARGRWRILVRGALQRALHDIRKYVLDENGRLVPAPKINIVLAGTEPRTGRWTLEEDDDEEDTE